MMKLMMACLWLGYATFAQAAEFACGPGFRLYEAYSADTHRKHGVRCVKSFANAERAGYALPTMIWYGEGRYAGQPYRHIGVAFTNSGDSGFGEGHHVAISYDIYGNGERFHYRSDNIYIRKGDRDYAYVYGDWHENWAPVEETDYVSTLPQVTTCGPNFTEYAVAVINEEDWGVRCVMSWRDSDHFPGLDPQLGYLWFGVGVEDGVMYEQMGAFAEVRDRGYRDYGQGFGLWDICFPDRSQRCLIWPTGSVTIAGWGTDHLNVDRFGDMEIWHR